MAKWKYALTEKGIKFYCNNLYRGEIITAKEIPDDSKKELAKFLIRIINSFIRDKEDD